MDGRGNNLLGLKTAGNLVGVLVRKPAISTASICARTNTKRHLEVCSCEFRVGTHFSVTSLTRANLIGGGSAGEKRRVNLIREDRVGLCSINTPQSQLARAANQDLTLS